MKIMHEYYSSTKGNQVVCRQITTNTNKCLLAVLTAGFDSGFSLGCSSIARFVADRIVDGFMAALGSPLERLSQSEILLRQAFQEGYLSQKNDLRAAAPTATFTALVIQQNQLSVVSIGSGQVVLIRDGKCIFRSAPHVYNHEKSDESVCLTTSTMFSDTETQKNELQVFSGDLIILGDYRLIGVHTSGITGELEGANSNLEAAVSCLRELKCHDYYSSFALARVDVG